MAKKSGTKLVDRAKKPAKKTPSAVERRRANLKPRIAQLYGRGKSRRQLATAYAEFLIEDKPGMTVDRRHQLARQLLRDWEREQEFRDMAWEEAVAELDINAPHILKGVLKKAKDGRVDAAKLALSVTQRHQPIEQAGGTANVQIVFASNIPRPPIVATPVPLAQEIRAIARQAGPTDGED